MEDDKSLLYACIINDVELIKERLEKATPAQLKKKDMEHGTALHAAAVHGNKEAVDLLLKKGADLSWKDSMKDTPMLSCIQNGKLEMAKYLIEIGSDVNAQGFHNRNGFSQLIVCRTWDKEFAQYLVDKGCDVNSMSRDQCSLLMDAAGYNNAEALKFLLDHGADKSKLPVVCCEAVLSKAVDTARFLFEMGITQEEMFQQGKGIERGCFHQALLQEGNEEMVKLLCRYIDLTAPPKRAVNTWTMTTKLSPLDFIKDLLSKGLPSGYQSMQEYVRIIEQNNSLPVSEEDIFNGAKSK